MLLWSSSTIEMYMIKIYQLFAATVHLFGQHVSASKHDFKKDPYWLFDSKTAYTLVHGNDLIVPKNCRIQQIFTMIRHGTRHPSTEDINGIKKLNDFKIDLEKKANLEEEDVTAILEWENELGDDIDKDLNEQGIRDMNELSSRIKGAFKDIFEEPFNPEIHKVLTSPEIRARQSGLHFLKNAFGDKILITSIDDLPIYKKDDVILNVSKFRKSILELDSVSEENENKDNVPKTEMTTFQESPIMLATLKAIAYRLGLESPITFDQGKSLYESCRHDRATHVDIDIIPAWCRVFSKQDLQVFDYLGDMNWYYKYGWGDELGVRLGCPLLTRLKLSFKLAAQKKGARGVFYFGHRANQFVAITMLGLAKDDTPLKADNMEQMAERKWRTSNLSPFAANTIAAFYKCDDDVDKVSFFVNEKIMPIDLGNNNTCTECLWKEVEEKFDKITADKKECAFGYDITPP